MPTLTYRHTPVVVSVVLVALALAPPATAQPPATRSLGKLDGQLRQLIGRPGARRKPAAGPLSATGVPVSSSGRVLVDVYVAGAMRPGADALRDEGMSVTAVSGRSPQRMVEGWLPVSALDDVAALGRTRAVVAVVGGFTNTGTVLSQGDAVHRGPQARALGPNGAGITVGVMSNSINQQGGGVAGSQAGGELPANVQVLDEQPGGSDEGRAMAEIVYDTAPGVPKIVFARGAGGIGPAQRAANIDALVANGAKVIADDTVFLTEPMFQDGVVAQAADRAKANGTAYLVSAGNRARQSWEGTFTPVGSENDFGGGDLRQTVVTMPAGTAMNPTTLTLVLDWGEPLGAVTSDFAIDVYVLPDETTPAPGFVDTNNIATGVPVESRSMQNTGAAVTISIGIRRVAGTGNPRLKWIANTNFGAFTPAEHNTSSPAIDPDAASARGTLAVAAVRHSDPGLNDVESFSSRGPTVTRYFSPTGVPLPTPDVRAKPDIAAADGVSTSVSGFNPFFGTSASAPSAAGVAALLLSANPSLPIDDLYAILRAPGGAVDCTAAGFPDADCGFGFVRADDKLRLLDSTPPVVAPVTSPAAPDGPNGWFRGAVGLTWSLVDPQSLVFAQTGCGPQSIATDGVATIRCSATTVGGTATQSATIKRDSTPPSPPVITGIDAASYSAVALPAAPVIGCSATDATSGVASCAVTGYGAGRGAHTLTATATDQAGLASTATLTYSVKPLALSALAAPRKVKLSKLLRSGITVTLGVAADRTAFVGTVTGGGAGAAVTLLGRARKTFDHGRRKLTIKLNRRGRGALRRKRTVKLFVTVAGRGANADPSARTRRFTASR